MTELIAEYIDIKDITHKVEHLAAVTEDGSDRQSIAEELYIALTRSNRQLSA